MVLLPLVFVASLILMWSTDEKEDFEHFKKSTGGKISDSLTILLITLITFFFNSLIIAVFYELGMKFKKKRQQK
jgi:hypothetical protein